MAAGMLALVHGGGWSFAEVKSPLDLNAITKFGKTLSGCLFVPSDAGYDCSHPVDEPGNGEISRGHRAVRQRRRRLEVPRLCSSTESRSCRAKVSAGNTAAEVLAGAAVYDLAPVLGECGSVDAGLVFGGGLGWLSGKFGATSDNLLSARLITEDGRTLVADSSTNSDLFWAIRGDGGNLGVATSSSINSIR